ncbi:cytochrome c [Oleiagrimonas sp. C23AA]|uniref:c-type cytochrome n=1 Tax=Oleiagrimonas sp. C23AA TaxID=2719047 RepID=UPI0014230DF8|nr:cytochrome c [Oleiagrimonas sp. C23AA]NII09394.1 cytochrome c [Oleiagrimonas sp. C23AA]
MKSVITLSVLAAALALSVPAAHAGNAAAGKKKAVSCFACHGADGNAVDQQYPRLAGQYENYIVQALKEYKSGQRDNAIMKGFAGQLSQQDMEDIATYYATLDGGKLHTLKNYIQGDSN